VKGDAPFRIPFVATDSGDPSPVVHCRDDQLVQQRGIDESVCAFRGRLADRLGEPRTSTHRRLVG